jgi:uncharacterized tellurite resistance protein B-like protein
MARDYTKYEVDGIDGVFGKGKLVLVVVQDYCSKNECTYDELKAVFPDEAQAGNTGVFGTLDEAKEIAKKRARHYVKDPIKLSDTKIAVSNQWGDNLPLFIGAAKGLGYDISVAVETSNESTGNGSNEQSDASSEEEDAVTRFNALEGIIIMFRLMLSVDGEVSDDEATKLVEVVAPYAESVGEDLGTVVANALEIYNSSTLEQNFKLVISFAASFSETSSHEVCIKIAKDLGKLALADGELDDNETNYWIHLIRAMGVTVDEVNGENEETSAEKQMDSNNYPLFPVNWGVENVIVVPIRHCMVADGVVNQMEKNAMAHFFENFGEIGEASSNVWDSTDDEIMQIHSDGKYGELLSDSAIYLKEHLDEDQLSKLIWYMATIVSEDDIIQYPEFVTLKFYFDQWFPDAMDNYMEKFKVAGMTVITSPNN